MTAPVLARRVCRRGGQGLRIPVAGALRYVSTEIGQVGTLSSQSLLASPPPPVEAQNKWRDHCGCKTRSLLYLSSVTSHVWNAQRGMLSATTAIRTSLAQTESLDWLLRANPRSYLLLVP